ncbi:MAG: glycosyltransferase family 4 protein [Pseudomonadota bacterium]
MKIAIVHEWLTTLAGSERVLEQMLQCFPNADIFAVVDFMPDAQREFLGGRRVTTSFLQGFPFARRHYRNYLPLMPLAIEQFDLSSYDLVLSSSHAVAKGVLTGPDQLHVSYIHSPIRFAWDLQHQYLRESGLNKGLKGFFVQYMLHKIRLWDCRTANSVDSMIANSRFIARRIRKMYRREAEVIYPPVDVSAFSLRANKEEFYVTASRMVPYKKIGLIVDAFATMPDKRLKVIGDGPDFAAIRARCPANVELLGYQSFDVLRDHLQRARAFVFAAEEDFGIAPVEAQACGTPVIAYAKGGVLETVIGLENEHPTGVFYPEQSIDSIRSAVMRFEAEGACITPHACRSNALRFSAPRFREEFSAYVEAQWHAFQRERVLDYSPVERPRPVPAAIEVSRG